MQPRALIAALSLAALAATAPSAMANPLPVGWTERPCVIVDARQFVLNLATGAEILPSAAGSYAVAGIEARLVDGRLVDTGGTPLPVVGGAIVDKAGKVVAMVSYWPRLACAPGTDIAKQGPSGPIGPSGPAGPAGAPGATGAPGAPGVTIQAAAPATSELANLRRQLVKARAQAKRWRKAAKAARTKRPAAAQPVVLG
jgi:hypothetical protein